MKIARANSQSNRAPQKWIESIVAEPELGEIYEGKVVKVMDFGAFVNFFGSGSKPATVRIAVNRPKLRVIRTSKPL